MNKTPLPLDFCPYVGLEPYTETHRDFFFGRERDQKLIISNLYAMPFTVLYGASGVGKSSVLLAGAVPLLKQAPDVDFVVFREWQSADFANLLKKEVLRAVVKGQAADEGALLQAINKRVVEEEDKSQALAKAREVTEGHSTKPADKKLLQEKKALLNSLDLIKSYLQGEFKVEDITFDELLFNCTLVSGRSIFFILDQFEEYFLYHPASKASDSFDAEFARAINRKEIPARFLLAMREEELGKLGRFRGRIPGMLSNTIFLKHLEPEDAKLAVCAPLEEYNRRVPDSQKMHIEEELVAAIIEKSRQTVGREGSEGAVASKTETQLPIETPVLQMLLTRLWEEERKAKSQMMRLSTLEGLGGAENIVRTYLDGVMNEMKEPQLGIAAEMFRYLVTPSGSKIAHTLPDLAAYTKLSEGQVEQTLKPLLISPNLHIMRKVSLTGQEDRYEIFHDVLGKAIVDWRRRYEIRKDEQAEAERRQQLKRALRRRMGVIALVIALIMMTGLTFFALQQRVVALKAKEAADTARSEADAQRTIAMVEKAKAETNFAELIKSQDVNTELVEKGSVKVETRPNEYIGIDVSRWQGEVDWMKIRQSGISFAYVKATDGSTGGVDNLFSANWRGTNNAGILRGAYHFLDPRQDAAKQAELFLKTIGDDSDLTPALVVELILNASLSAETYMQGMRVWLQTVEQRTGCKPLVYSPKNFANEFITSPEFSNYPLWTANYSEASPRNLSVWGDNWVIWQYTAAGKVDGVKGPVDLNRMPTSVLDKLRCRMKP